MRFPNSRWQLVFLILTGLQALAIVGLELQIFITSHNFYYNNSEHRRWMSDLTTYFTVLMFGIFYQLVITWDAFRLESVIQVIALVAYNFALLLYVMIQKSQLCWIHTCKSKNPDEKPGVLWSKTSSTATALEWMVAGVTLVLAFSAWRLFQERLWKKKSLGSDLSMVKKYHTYQVYMALIKIDIFLYLAFNGQIIMKQILAPPDSGHTWNKTLKCEAAITIIGMINLPLGAFFIRKERLSGSNIVLFILFIQLAWSIYIIGNLVYRFNNPKRHKTQDIGKLQERLMDSRMVIIIIGVNTVVLIAATMAASIACMLNFGKGLRQHVSTRPWKALPQDRWTYLTSESGGHMIRERIWRAPTSSGEAS